MFLGHVFVCLHASVCASMCARVCVCVFVLRLFVYGCLCHNLYGKYLKFDILLLTKLHVYISISLFRILNILYSLEFSIFRIFEYCWIYILHLFFEIFKFEVYIAGSIFWHLLWDLHIWCTFLFEIVIKFIGFAM